MSANMPPYRAAEARLPEPKVDSSSSFWHKAENFRLYLRSVAARVLGQRLAHKLDPSDVVQQALLVAFARRAQFHGQNPGQWQHWVLTIVRNQARKVRRYWSQERRDVRRERPLPVDSDHEYLLAARDFSPGHQESCREEVSRLLAALQRLPADYQQVLRLRTFEDLPLAEVARQMKRSTEAVRKLWTRAVQSLREELGGEP